MDKVIKITLLIMFSLGLLNTFKQLKAGDKYKFRTIVFGILSGIVGILIYEILFK